MQYHFVVLFFEVSDPRRVTSFIKMKLNRSLNTTNGLLANGKMESSFVTTRFGLFCGHHQVTIQ
jgi:hypothetical protein